MWYSIGMILLSIIITIFTSLFVCYWAWKYIADQEFLQKRGFTWHSFFKNNIYARLGENKNDPWTLEIRYNLDIRKIKNLQILKHGYLLCLPYSATMSEFTEYAKSLNPEDSPLHKLIRAIVNEEELCSLELNEQEMIAFHEFKNNIINLALVKD